MLAYMLFTLYLICEALGGICRAHPDLNQGPADLQAAALTTELCTQMTSNSLALFGVTLSKCDTPVPFAPRERS